METNKSNKSGVIALRLSIVVLAMMFGLVVYFFPKTKTIYAGDNIWTWTGLGGNIRSIVTNPINPNVIYAISGNGQLLKSADGGNTWPGINSSDWYSAGYYGVDSISIAYDSPNILYASVEGGGTGFHSGVYRTNDGGTSWALVREISGTVGTIAVSPTNWREIYVGQLVVGANFQSSLVKSTDGGATWTDLSSGLHSPCNLGITRIFIAPSAPHILIIQNQFGVSLCKSTDGGNTWSSLPNAPWDLYSAVIDPKNSNTIYIGTGSPGGWKSTDGGSTWQPLANGLQQNGYGFVIDPDNTQVVHAANGSAGVLGSLDGGTSWASINTGIQGLEVRSIAIASRNPLVIYASLVNAGIWKMTRTTVQDFSITVNNGALYTNQTAVTLTLTAPPGTTQMLISNDGGFGGASWEPFANTKAWTITSYGAYAIPRTVYAKFMTNSQISGQYQDDIVLDQTPPTGSFQITNPSNASAAVVRSSVIRTTSVLTYTLYLPLLMKNYTPGVRAVGLALSATDDLSGVGSMLISNDAAFTGAQWQDYATQLNWNVNEHGSTTVYVKFRDRAGNESQVYSTATTAP